MVAVGWDIRKEEKLVAPRNKVDVGRRDSTGIGNLVCCHDGLISFSEYWWSPCNQESIDKRRGGLQTIEDK